jgi:hypothetical protein
LRIRNKKERRETMNFLTVNFSDEDRARIDRLTDALEVLARAAYVLSENAEKAAVPAAAPAVVLEPVEVAGPAPFSEAPVDEPELAAPAAPVVSLAEFQKELSLRCAVSADEKARVRAIINEYAAAASAVPEEKRAEILARLAAQ